MPVLLKRLHHLNEVDAIRHGNGRVRDLSEEGDNRTVQLGTNVYGGEDGAVQNLNADEALASGGRLVLSGGEDDGSLGLDKAGLSTWAGMEVSSSDGQGARQTYWRESCTAAEMKLRLWVVVIHVWEVPVKEVTQA